MKLHASLRLSLALGLLLGATLPTAAQMVGLPVLDTADHRDPGRFELMPGASFGEEMDFFGARASYTILDELRGFLDLGRLQTEDKGENLALQAGGLCSLPGIDFCDTALRATGYYANTDYLDIIGADLMLVASGETLLDDLFIYGGVGADYSERKIFSATHSEINPSLAAGMCYKFTRSFVVFIEGDYIDGLYAAAGLSIRP